MQPVDALTVDEIDLSDITFWERPWEEREGAFALLRRARPLAFFHEPDPRETSPFAPPPGPPYRAGAPLARVKEISPDPRKKPTRAGARAVCVVHLGLIRRAPAAAPG
jgi:hypothetical protein